MSEINSTCPYCGVGCGVSIKSSDQSKGDTQPKQHLVLGSQDHHANFGRLCSKGSALGETLLPAEQSNRIIQPEINNQAVDWDRATSDIADAIQDSIEKYGKDSIAFYLSGQLLTEDYYVANKLIKGYIGTANVDTNSRLCMASAVAGYKRAFGSDSVPCSYEDLEHADLIVLIGSNAAWTHPVLYQRMVAAKQDNPNLKVVLIDPRKTASDDLADLHLSLRPSSDGFLFQGLLNYLHSTNSIDTAYIEKYTEGFDAAIEQISGFDIDFVAQQTDLDVADLTKFYQWFAKTNKTISFYSQGINQSATGTDKCNAIINCHLATGRIGIEGAGPFSITGQPNAMGGREVGGLANQLAAHMDFLPDDVDRVQRFWSSPDIATEPGLKAVELFDAINEGKIKVLWIMATNPAVSLPDSNNVRLALEKCPLVIVSDITRTDTSKYADILLPAQGWSEKDGTVTNSERRISRQRKFINPPESVKPDWWALSQVGIKLGYDSAFNYKTARDVFIEHAQLSGFENNLNQRIRDFDISGLSQLTEHEYQELEPIQWPVNQQSPQGTARMFTDGEFFTPNRKAQFINSVASHADINQNETYPLLLNTGRLRDQWHTMTRTGLASTLTGHDTVPFIEINSKDSENLKLSNNCFAKITSQYGSFIGRIDVTNTIKQGQLFSPIHWNDQFSKHGVISNVISPTVDPVSGQPESKAVAVAIEEYQCKQWIRVISHKQIDTTSFSYWASSKTKNGIITLLGTNEEINWQKWAQELQGTDSKQMFFADSISKEQRLLVSNNDNIEMLLYANINSAKLPSDIWMMNAFVNTAPANISKLIQGEDGDQDKLICSCFNVTKKTIKEAISDNDKDLQTLGAKLGCGTKCGSCKPELSMLLNL